MDRRTSRFLTAATAVTAALVFIAVMSGWLAPGWTALGIIAVATMIFAGWTGLREESGRAAEGPRPASPAVPPPPPPFERLPLKDVPLPSAEPAFPFLLSATVCWYQNAGGDPRQRVPATVAANAILRRAERLAAGVSPADWQSLAFRLAMELGIAQSDPTATVTAWAAWTTLGLSDADTECLGRVATADKREWVRAHERALGRQHREYLAEDVFASTGSAAVWWLARDDSRVAETVGLMDAFGRLSTEVNPLVAAGPALAPEPAWAPVTDPATDAVIRLIPDGDDRRALFSDEFAILLERFNMVAEAERVRSAFGAPTFAEMPEEPAPDDGVDPYDLR
jgi:hypothetical protein